jgi:protein SCO1/2
VDVVRESGDRFGEDFRVLAVAFDIENDKPEVLRSYGESFTPSFENWKFVTMENSAQMKNFLSRFGFTYKKTNLGYDHLNMISVVGKDGTLMAHFFGDQFKPESVLKALDLATPAKLDFDALSLVDKAFFFCSYYDPATGAYKVDYVFLGQFAGQYLLALGTIIFVGRKNLFYFIKKLRGKRKFLNVIL